MSSKKILIILLSIVMLVIMITATGIGIYFFFNYQRASRPRPIKLATFADLTKPIQNEQERLTTWNQFADLPTPNTCLLMASDSCFPQLLFTPDALIGGKFVIQKPLNGIIDFQTVRSILLADQVIKNKLLALPSENINGEGLFVDRIIHTAIDHNINPFVVIKIIKLQLATDLANLESENPSINTTAYYLAVGRMDKISQEASSEIASYVSIFSAQSNEAPLSSGIYKNNKALQALLAGSTSPIQKAVIMYFFVHLTLNQYRDFVQTFNTDTVPTTGTFPMKLVNSQGQLPKSSELRIRFCYTQNQTVLECGKDTNNFLCMTIQSDKICLSNYSLGR